MTLQEQISYSWNSRETMTNGSVLVMRQLPDSIHIPIYLDGTADTVTLLRMRAEG